MPSARSAAAAEGLPASTPAPAVPDAVAGPASVETELARLRAVVARLNDDERAAIHALALALASDTNADRVAAMAPHIGREKAEAAHKLALEMDR